VTEPAVTPVTTPVLVIVATAILLLDQVPADAGVTLAVKPTQTADAPPRVGLEGMALMTTFAEATDTQLFELVTVKV
jgi:hypothetical protein